MSVHEPQCSAAAPLLLLCGGYDRSDEDLVLDSFIVREVPLVADDFSAGSFGEQIENALCSDLFTDAERSMIKADDWPICSSCGVS